MVREKCCSCGRCHTGEDGPSACPVCGTTIITHDPNYGGCTRYTNVATRSQIAASQYRHDPHQVNGRSIGG